MIMSKRRYLELPLLMAAVVSVAFSAPALGEQAKTTVTTKVLKLGAGTESPWLGVVCAAVDPAVRAHTDLPEGQGIMVEKVLPGSPAEKAGLARYDILLAADGKPLAKAEDLVEAVAQGEGKGIPLELIRSGEKHAVIVTPELRPGQRLFVLSGDRRSLKELQGWVMQLAGPHDGRTPLTIKSVGPGLVTSRSVVTFGREFPEDLKVRIIKEGKKPAKHSIEWGDESWEVSEEELDQLPDKVKPYVQQLRARRVANYVKELPSQQTGSHYTYVYTKEGASSKDVSGTDRDVERRLESVERQLKEVLDELRKLRAERSDEEAESQEDDAD
jgi:membrane-associated protease RseP (regulator of RpoE activity)